MHFPRPVRQQKGMSPQKSSEFSLPGSSSCDLSAEPSSVTVRRDKWTESSLEPYRDQHTLNLSILLDVVIAADREYQLSCVTILNDLKARLFATTASPRCQWLSNHDSSFFDKAPNWMQWWTGPRVEVAELKLVEDILAVSMASCVWNSCPFVRKSSSACGQQ